ncbi:DMT family protein [Phenylobacterium sp.]|uniref:DMT family protein n=1 Tax=Phenylobacterium sp. TaxID=1871053 RepID=UPI00273142F7|nr:DMT family protein [Phenylobacterium sp.]MDP1872605.1 DMT family protein [Phenylobacterium sp.]MDP3299436.1 DMT family protein [Phenylobacterium sp.]MDP3488622.1 DMT family protein [Phenylobacterium sp.]
MPPSLAPGLAPLMAFAAPVVLLVFSNIFMTFAWYGHLKVEHRPLWIIILVSWGIAFFEYCLAVPANRIGRDVYSPAELKTMQEVITLAVFAVFSVMYLGERFTWNHAVGFGLIAAGALFIFKGPIRV